MAAILKAVDVAVVSSFIGWMPHGRPRAARWRMSLVRPGRPKFHTRALATLGWTARGARSTTSIRSFGSLALGDDTQLVSVMAANN